MTEAPRVILIAHDNEGSVAIARALHNTCKNSLVGIVVTRGLYYRKGLLSSLLKMLREASLHFLINRFLDLVRYRIDRGESLTAFCSASGVPFISSRDVNSGETVAHIRSWRPDYLVGSFTMHIIGQELISVPRVAAIGVHPSLIPSYRGLEVFFWMLANDEQQGGTSVFLLERQIDVGTIVAQETWPIEREDTVVSLYKRLTESCARLLSQTVGGDADHMARMIASCQPVKVVPSYFPMPTRESYRRFREAGRRWR
jgi:folate-dependent phosphoribosylglycinamide formyltransferase PurN